MNSSGLLLFFTLFAVDASNVKKRVIGGEKVNALEAPYHATVNLHGRYMCAASLITKWQLLTAAHCLDKLIGLRVEFHTAIIVLVGTLFVKYGIPHEVKRISHHKGFNRKTLPYALPNDIGVIHLKWPIFISKSVAPLSLPVKTTTLFDGAPTSFVGFGCQDQTDKPAERLTRIILTIESLKMCKAKNPIYKIDDNNICALSDPNSGCSRGDDGGAMTDIFQEVILGVLSVSKGNVCSNCSDIFTKVSHYLDYIHEELNYDFENQTDTGHPAINYPFTGFRRFIPNLRRKHFRKTSSSLSGLGL